MRVAFGLGDVRRIQSPVAVIGHFGQAEVENLGRSAQGDKDVCRFDIAMHDALGVRRIQRFGYINRNREQLFHLDGPIPDEMFQRLAFQVLHDNEGLVAFFADVINGADVGMVQGGRCLGLSPEASEGGRVAGDVFRKKLQSDKTMQAGVFSFVNHAHPATAELLDHPVVRDVLADHFAHGEVECNARRQNFG